MFLANLHVTMSKGRHGDVFRQICGAGVAAKQSDFNYDNDSSSDEDANNDKVKPTLIYAKLHFKSVIYECFNCGSTSQAITSGVFTRSIA
jgi:hypothetical protein